MILPVAPAELVDRLRAADAGRAARGDQGCGSGPVGAPTSSGSPGRGTLLVVGTIREENMIEQWPPDGIEVERYCLISGRAVSMIPGDRCLAHGAAAKPCMTDVRPAQCRHEHLSPNHPRPHCSECGKDVEPEEPPR